MFYLDRLPGPVLVTDCNGRIKHSNCDFKRLAGAGAAEGMDQFFPPASRIFLHTHAWPLLLRNGEFSELYLQLQSENGQSIPVMANARISEVDGAPEVIWLFFVAKDRQRFEAELLKAREQAQESAAQLAKANLALQSAYAQLANYAVEIQSEAEQLAQLSHTDPLTALSNRRALSVHVEQWLGNVSDLACGSLLLIDIDHFKQINDRFGHAEEIAFWWIWRNVFWPACAVATAWCATAAKSSRYGCPTPISLKPATSPSACMIRSRRLRSPTNRSR